MYNYVFTCGDFNGIGPEICLKAINQIDKSNYNKIYFLIPHNIFTQLSTIVKPEFEYNLIKKLSDEGKSKIQIVDLGESKLKIGVPTKSSGKIAFKAVKKSYNMINKGIADAVITAPISKTAFKIADIDFPGHTELYAELSKTKNFGMMFLSGIFHSMLFTIHEPIKKVPSLIKKKSLIQKIDLTIKSLKNDLKIENPKVALLGLNPHAGENGKIGNEEEIIEKAIDEFPENAFGPFVPDAFFANKLHEKYDCTLGMYHDQVLIPFKLLNFDKGVNFTAGLPFVRTSPDHGTAYDIAWQNKANPTSIIESFNWAREIVTNRKKAHADSQ